MKRILTASLLALAAACAPDQPGPVTPDAAPSAAAHQAGGDGKYIVALKEGADPRSVAALLGIRPKNVYTAAINGFAGELTAGQVTALRRNPNVAYVEPDAEARLATTQIFPVWGIDRIDEPTLPRSNTFTYTSAGAGVVIYVLDTGVRKTHKQFGGRASYIPSAVNGNFVGDARPNAEDCHGHGTHVAATAAGVGYGVAKRAMIRAGRVVNCSGGGNASMLIAAIDWIIANGDPPGVVNMSLGYGDVQAVRDAAQSLYLAGYVPVAAAGNGDYLGNPLNACDESPAGALNALTVGATDSTDHESSFSNYGRCIDLFAPGSSVKSAEIAHDSAFGTRSGTSMAAPHAAGVAAQYLAANPGSTPYTVMTAMKSIATTGVITRHAASVANYTPNRLLFTNY
ncbi:MAG TPA: S8 family peptidase [Longimicrobium sp.]|nr:S8 family peptidase [Longimicrobium sp.]